VCGIVCVFKVRPEETMKLRTRSLEMARKVRHRGPDWSGIFASSNAILCHERLAIVGIDTGAQPLLDHKTKNALAVNGEIYNHLELRKTLKGQHEFQTHSDCEVLLYLYSEKGTNFLEDLNGIFAFVLFDEQKNSFLIARDPLGVVPLYIGYDSSGHFWVASELKALESECTHIEEFPPGHYFEGTASPQSMTDTSHEEWMKPVRYFKPPWIQEGFRPKSPFDPKVLRAALEQAVKRQLMTEVPFGVLLSGGLDSSLIAGLVIQELNKMIEREERSLTIKTFSIGLEGSPDLAAAKIVAKALGTEHHTVHFTVQEGLDAISDVIFHLETYDVTTIRAATPMYLLSRKIKSMGIKMILSGEGSDEIFGGYLYFHKAPNAQEFQEELIRKISALHKYDCLRANKSTAAWGVEARVPFLDLEFLKVAMNIDPQFKMCGNGVIEKKILRESFENLIPHEVLWRQKEQFSDGVGYGWIDALKAFANQEVWDTSMARARFKFPINPPQTKEAYWYRSLFARHFPNPAVAHLVPGGPSVACSTPTAIKWDASFANSADPSGRSVKGVHLQNGKNLS
jgi:asparagine synthase (glutamine-hydrolysing)